MRDSMLSEDVRKVDESSFEHYMCADYLAICFNPPDLNHINHEQQ